MTETWTMMLWTTLRDELSICSDRYGEKSILQLLPVSIAGLEDMNHIFQKNRELEAINDFLRNKHEKLQSCLAKEKLLRKQALDMSFNIEN